MSRQMSLLLLLTLFHDHVTDRNLQWHTCGTSDRLTRQRSTVNKCMRSCARRAYCLAVSYNRKSQQCTLHDNTDTRSDCVDHVYVKKQYFDRDVTDQCAIRSCLPDQFCWNPCMYKECRPIPHVPHATVYGNILDVDAKVKYVCTATGDVTIVTCQSDGQWSTLPVCLADCGEPPQYPNTVLSSGTTTAGSTRRYTCIDDYAMSAGRIVLVTTCQRNGQWGHDDFQCLIDASIWPYEYTGTCNTTATGRTCQRWDTHTPHHNDHTDAMLFPETTLQGAENYCRDPDYSDYQWCLTTDPIMLWELCATEQCQFNCGSPPTYPNSIVSSGNYRKGSTRGYTCLGDYVISTGSDVIITTCQANGEWAHRDFQCLLKSSIDCGLPAIVPNTEMRSGSTIFDSRRNYTCSPGYGVSHDRYTASMAIQCQPNGQWTAVNFKCLIDCGVVSVRSGTSLHGIEGTLEGGKYVLVCAEGYTLYPDDMPHIITCLSNGSWEHVFDPVLQCLPDQIGKTCSEADHCTEPNSRCLETGSTDYPSRCYCQPLYEYSRPKRTCAKVCSSYGTTYRLETNRILLHIIEQTLSRSVGHCRDHCVLKFGDMAPSFKYNNGSSECRCMSATVQQVRDGCPQLLIVDDRLYNFYERECVP